MSGSTHEDFGRNEPVKGSSDRSFGLVFVAVFLWIGLAPLRRHLPVRPWALVMAGLLLLVALLAPKILHPANRLWTQLALLMNRVVSPVAMGVIFFLVATPLGALMRLFGQDPLKLRFDASAQSYWVTRIPPGPDPAAMRNQF